MKEQEYQQKITEQFRYTSEGINSRVVWLSVFQAMVLLASGAWQARRSNLYCLYRNNSFSYKK